MSSAALAVLAEVPEIGPHEGRGYIFTTDGEHPISGFSKFKREFDEAVLTVLREHDAGAKPIPNWTLHDLRRTARQEGHWLRRLDARRPPKKNCRRAAVRLIALGRDTPWAKA